MISGRKLDGIKLNGVTLSGTRSFSGTIKIDVGGAKIDLKKLIKLVGSFKPKFPGAYAKSPGEIKELYKIIKETLTDVRKVVGLDSGKTIIQTATLDETTTGTTTTTTTTTTTRSFKEP